MCFYYGLCCKYNNFIVLQLVLIASIRTRIQYALVSLYIDYCMAKVPYGTFPRKCVIAWIIFCFVIFSTLVKGYSKNTTNISTFYCFLDIVPTRYGMLKPARVLFYLCNQSFPAKGGHQVSYTITSWLVFTGLL